MLTVVVACQAIFLLASGISPDDSSLVNSLAAAVIGFGALVAVSPGFRGCSRALFAWRSLLIIMFFGLFGGFAWSGISPGTAALLFAVPAIAVNVVVSAALAARMCRRRGSLVRFTAILFVLVVTFSVILGTPMAIVSVMFIAASAGRDIVLMLLTAEFVTRVGSGVYLGLVLLPFIGLAAWVPTYRRSIMVILLPVRELNARGLHVIQPLKLEEPAL